MGLVGELEKYIKCQESMSRWDDRDTQMRLAGMWQMMNEVRRLEMEKDKTIISNNVGDVTDR